LEIKKEAFSSAYYIAGVVCQVGDPYVRKKYLRKAFTLMPSKYFGEYRNRLLEVIIPVQFYPFHNLIKVFILLFTDPVGLFIKIRKKLKIARNQCDHSI